MRLFWDIEANDLLEGVSKVWIVAAVDLDTGAEYVWNCNGLNGGIDAALDFLSGADLLVAHNGIRYDQPALIKLFGWRPSGVTRDSMVAARLKFPNLMKTDEALVKSGKLESKLQGRDSLKAWGQRIGIHKDEYEGGFDAWSQEMQDYCVQDCRTGAALWNYLQVETTMDPRAVALEHRIAEVCFLMEEAGWYFDEPRAQALYTHLVARRHELETALVDKFGTWTEVDKVIIPKRDNKTLGYVKGVPVTKYKEVTFNPGSRRHIEKKLRELGWEPQEFTPSGAAKLDEEVLERIEIPEAALIIEYLLVEKRLGQIADGNNGWLKLVKNGKIHPGYKTMGTVTGRAAHMRPNVAQTPTGKAPYGEECRACWTVPKGWKLVGADFEGLELRCLAHFLGAFDKGNYAKVVTEGDVHQYHADALGCSRPEAKTFIYAWLYGAGVPLLAAYLKLKIPKTRTVIDRFTKRVPGLDKLKKAVAAGAAKGYLKGLDGRQIPVRSAHSALNALLQSAGAVLCKLWVVAAYDALIAAGYRWGYEGDFVMVGWIHDEIQIAVREGLEEEIGNIVVNAARNVGNQFNFRCRLDSKAVVGSSWKETH